MKKFLFLAGLVVAAACFASCSNSPKAKSENGSDSAEAAEKLVSVTLDNGETVKVEAYTAEHYIPFTIQMALRREATAGKIVRPTDASAFGKKTFIAECKVINQWDRPSTETGKLNGTATVIHYEKGVEIVRDGKSWFYDYDNFCYDNPGFFEYAAAESVLHPGVWEPVFPSVDNAGNLILAFVYGCDNPYSEFLQFRQDIRRELKFNHTCDLQISRERF